MNRMRKKASVSRRNFFVGSKKFLSFLVVCFAFLGLLCSHRMMVSATNFETIADQYKSQVEPEVSGEFFGCDKVKDEDYDALVDILCAYDKKELKLMTLEPIADDLFKKDAEKNKKECLKEILKRNTAYEKGKTYKYVVKRYKDVNDKKGEVVGMISLVAYKSSFDEAKPMVTASLFLDKKCSEKATGSAEVEKAVVGLAADLIKTLLEQGVVSAYFAANAVLSDEHKGANFGSKMLADLLDAVEEINVKNYEKFTGEFTPEEVSTASNGVFNNIGFKIICGYDANNNKMKAVFDMITSVLGATEGIVNRKTLISLVPAFVENQGLKSTTLGEIIPTVIEKVSSVIVK